MSDDSDPRVPPGEASLETVVQQSDGTTEFGYPFVLTVVDGPGRGESYAIDPAEPNKVLVGSSPACELKLEDASVSRRHLALEPVSQRLKLRDLGSANGTEVDGLVVIEAMLRGGETLRVGQTSIRCERSESAKPRGLPQASRFGRVLGKSRSMRRLYPLCERLAASNVPVIIEGETGTGKELLAESLHQNGPRARGPFVVFDCGAVAPELIEEELFGRERGTVTGEVTVTAGAFEHANGGTLFIDEIAELPLELQPKLLRAIERPEITRVGTANATPVDVRILSSTRRDLDRMVQQGRFRDDLFHRLAVTRIELPPLRSRSGDVVMLARYFWTELGGTPGALPKKLLEQWDDDSWPGNVRELRNTVVRRLALGDLIEEPGRTLDGDEAGLSLGSSRQAVHTVSPAGDPIAAILAMDLPLADARARIVQEFEHRYVERILALHDNNVTRAAAAAGVARRHLQRLKARFRGD